MIFHVSVYTISNIWLHKMEVIQCIKMIQKEMWAHHFVMVEKNNELALKQFTDIFRAPLTDDNIGEKRKAALDWMALSKGVLPSSSDGISISQVQGQSQEQEQEQGEKSIDEIRRDLDEMELLTEGIDDVEGE